jgi:hypothetical protein
MYRHEQLPRRRELWQRLVCGDMQRSQRMPLDHRLPGIVLLRGRLHRADVVQSRFELPGRV